MTEEEKRSGNTEIQSFSFPKYLVKRLRKYCRKQETKKSPVVVTAVEEFLDSEEES